MKIRLLKPSSAVLLVVVALVIGLEAPAMAHQATVIAHKISGSELKNNSVTGRQIKESTLSTVPSAANARKLAGKPGSAYAPAAAARASGLIKIPTGGKSHVLFTDYPLTWKGTCVVSGGGATFTLSVTAAENVDFTQGPSTSDLGTIIAAGKSLEIDNGGASNTLQTVTFYTVTGHNGANYSGLFTGMIHVEGVPCGVSVTASG
jgi:hypothetical protein